MVVLCPNCGREIFSDPDYCVLCGWKKGERASLDTAEEPRYRDQSQAPRRDLSPPRAEYDAGGKRPHGDRHQGRIASRPVYEDMRSSAPRPAYGDREEPGEENRKWQADRRGAPPSQARSQRQYYDERRQPPPVQQDRRSRSFRPDYQPEARRPPPVETGGRGYEKEDTGFCPNCGREIFTDPDNCVLCGWSREADQRMAQPQPDMRRQYERTPPRDFRAPGYGADRRPRERGISSPAERGREYKQGGPRRTPPENWERRINEKLGVREPKPSDEGRFWYRSKEESPEKDRFVCDNCGNPSLQFFADGLGRCPGCGQRFRYSPRPVSSRSKQKHKQFVCSKCDSKNLQFFLDGTGACPHCKREFKWKK